MRAHLSICLIGALAAPAAASVKKAKRAFNDERYHKAAVEAFRALKKAKGGKARSSAEWWLAQSLLEMGFSYAASFYYGRIVERGMRKGNIYFLKALSRLGKVDQQVALGPAQMTKILGARVDASRIPKAARGLYFYYKGVESFQRRRFRSADKALEKVKSSSDYHLKALFHRGVIANVSGRHDRGIKSFERVIDSADDEANGPWLREQAHLNIARIHYEMKRFPDAIRHYAEIRRNSDSWLQALFEASWAFFLMEKANNALGNIHTLHSPFFKDRFYPESFILQAVIFLRMCRHDEVKKSTELFKKRYGSSLKDIQALLRKTEGDHKAFFRHIYNYKTAKKTSFPAAAAILDSLGRTDSYKQAGLSVINSDRELDKLADAPSSWRKVGLTQSLRKALKSRKTKAIATAGKDLYRKGVTSYKYLIELNNQTKLITAELLLGKVDDIRKQLNIDTAPRKQQFIGGMQELRVGQKLEYWPFESEYWEDELGGYVFNIDSKCKGES